MRRYTKKSVITVVVVVLFIVFEALQESGLLPQSSKNTSTTSTTFVSSTSKEFHTVTRVVDGDTIVIDTGEKIRYIGVNTPESVDPRRSVQCFGKEAAKYNTELVAGRKIALVSDVGDKDKYGRLLRYVYLEDDTFVNLKLVRDGYASVLTIPPNVAHASEFAQAEREAREVKRGLWGACK